MPAYFNIMIEFDRNSINHHTVDELSFYLKHAGLKFRGCPGDWVKFTEKDMIARNQRLLEKSFELAPDQDKSEGYVQAEYDLEGFSGARGFFINNYPEEGEFTYQLVIPEEEIVTGTDSVSNEAAERVLRLITNIWHMPSIVTIQTSTELKGELVSASKFGEWKLPAANPYALVSEIQLKSIPAEGFDVKKFHVGGIILTNQNYIIK